MPPLHTAFYAGNAHAVRALTQAGANLEQTFTQTDSRGRAVDPMSIREGISITLSAYEKAFASPRTTPKERDFTTQMATRLHAMMAVYMDSAPRTENGCAPLVVKLRDFERTGGPGRKSLVLPKMADIKGFFLPSLLSCVARLCSTHRRFCKFI